LDEPLVRTCQRKNLKPARSQLEVGKNSVMVLFSRGNRPDLDYDWVVVTCEPLWLRSAEFARGSL
jgi:hypothetical protein